MLECLFPFPVQTCACLLVVGACLNTDSLAAMAWKSQDACLGGGVPGVADVAVEQQQGGVGGAAHEAFQGVLRRPLLRLAVHQEIVEQLKHLRAQTAARIRACMA